MARDPRLREDDVIVFEKRFSITARITTVTFQGIDVIKLVPVIQPIEP